MKKRYQTACVLISAAFALPLAAEPMSFNQLSVHADGDQGFTTSQIRVGKTAGMDKYAPYKDRFTDLSADTEIAVFEEYKGKDQRYHRPARANRVPSM